MIEAFIVAWNEAETIGMTIKHYQKFCTRINIYDNHSSDDTVKIAKSMGCYVRTFGKVGELSDYAYLEVKNNCWKASRAQWVIVVDADEILQISPDTISESGTTIYKTQGWNVFSYDMPVESWDEVNTGVMEENYSKTVIFNPRAITEINFRAGCHTSSPKGNIVWTDGKLFLFHYRNVGGPERLVQRHALYRPRMSKENMDKKLGIHYLYEDEVRIKEWEEKYKRSKPFSPDGF